MMPLTYKLAQIRSDEFVEEAARHRLARQAAAVNRAPRRRSDRRPPRRGGDLFSRRTPVYV
jgi:hypothetical protein